MFIKLIVLVITSLVTITSIGVLYWLTRKQRVQIPGTSGQETIDPGDQDESKDELSDDQAAEVVATWNILNPPS